VRELTLEEDYGKIEMMAATHLENEKLEKLIKKWRKEVLVEIRMTE
jgi:peptidyl-prolyl cis-trans isomerase SurA